MSGLDYYAAKSKYYDLIHEERIRKAPVEVDFFIRIFKEHNLGKRVLDVGCGTGRFSKIFWEKGFSVVGIDVSEEMIKIAKAKSHDPGVRFEVADMRTFKSDELFDAAVLGDGAIMHLLAREDTLKALKNIKDNLKEGGIFVLNFFNYAEWETLEATEEWGLEKDGAKVHVKRSQSLDENGFFEWEDTITVKEESAKMGCKIKAWKFSEWMQMFREAGFKLEAVFDGEFNKNPEKPPREVYYLLAK